MQLHQQVSVYSPVQYNLICVICMCMLSYIVKYNSLVTTLESHHKWSWIKIPSPSVHFHVRFQWSDSLQTGSLCAIVVSFWQTIYTLCELESHLSTLLLLFSRKIHAVIKPGFFLCSYYFTPHLMAALYNLGNEQTHTYILPV